MVRMWLSQPNVWVSASNAAEAKKRQPPRSGPGELVMWLALVYLVSALLV